MCDFSTSNSWLMTSRNLSSCYDKEGRGGCQASHACNCKRKLREGNCNRIVQINPPLGPWSEFGPVAPGFPSAAAGWAHYIDSCTFLTICKHRTRPQESGLNSVSKRMRTRGWSGSSETWRRRSHLRCCYVQLALVKRPREHVSHQRAKKKREILGRQGCLADWLKWGAAWELEGAWAASSRTR